MTEINYIKGYKVRIYPTKEQEENFNKHIGACRYVWNYFLELENENYKNGGKFIDHYDLNRKLTELKKEEGHEWLNEVSCDSLQRICGDLAKAFKRFFKKDSKYPKFKSKKRSKPNYPVRNSTTYFKTNEICMISGIGKVKYKTDFKLPLDRDTKIWNPRVSYDHGKWYISFGLSETNLVDVDYNEYENQVFNDLPDKSLVGIDLGIKTLATVAYNDKCITYPNINKSEKMRKLEKDIKHLERNVSRKYRTNGNFEKSNRIKKEEAKVAKKRRKEADIRMNHIHQITSEIIKMRPQQVVMEDLRVRNMMRNRHLSKSIQDSSFFTFIDTMRYKCSMNGIRFKQVPSNYPSSKTCSNCGYIKKDLKLKDRTYVCPECGLEIDRDYNAAINLMNYKFND